MSLLNYRLEMDGADSVPTVFDGQIGYATSVPLVQGIEIELSQYVDGGYQTERFVVTRIVQQAQLQPMGGSRWRCLDDPFVTAHIARLEPMPKPSVNASDG